MIKFFIWLLLVVIFFIYYNKYKCDWYFNFYLINRKYNLVLINFIYYDKNNNIRHGKMIVPKSDAREIINILEECFLEKINI